MAKCSDCGIELNEDDLMPRNIYPEHNDYFCDRCLDRCSKCGRLFADYWAEGICENCSE